MRTQARDVQKRDASARGARTRRGLPGRDASARVWPERGTAAKAAPQRAEKRSRSAPTRPPARGLSGAITELLCVFMLGAFPLIIGARRYADLPTVRVLWLYGAVAAVSVALALSAVIPRPRLGRNRAALLPRPPELCLAAYLLIAGISAALSPFPDTVLFGAGTRFDGLLTQACYAAIYVAVSRGCRPGPLPLVAAALAALAACGIGIAQFFGLDLLRADSVTDTYFLRVFYSTFGHLDIFSTYTSFFAAFFGFLFAGGRGRLRALWLAAGVACFAQQVILNTAAGWVALVGAALLMLPAVASAPAPARRLCGYAAGCLCAGGGFYLAYGCAVLGLPLSAAFPLPWAAGAFAALALWPLAALAERRSAAHPVRGRRAVLFAGGLLAACALSAAYFLYRGREGSVFFELTRILSGDARDEFGSGRLFLWRRGAELFLSHPLIGTGADTFGRALVAAFGERALDYSLRALDKAHNEYLQILCTHGALGLAAHLGFLVCGARDFAAARRRAGHTGLTLAVQAGILAYWIQSLFTFTIPIITPVIWVFYGMATALSRPEASGELGSPPPPVASSGRSAAPMPGATISGAAPGTGTPPVWTPPARMPVPIPGGRAGAAACRAPFPLLQEDWDVLPPL